MSVFELTSIVVCLAAAFGLVSHRFLRLPATIGTMVLSLVLALVLIVTGKMVPSLHEYAVAMFQRIDFHDLVLHCLLAFLLFAGALHLDLDELKRQKAAVFLLSTLGTVASAGIVAALLWVILRAVHLPASAMSCMIFGALISPTDPIAVLEMLRRVGAPAEIQALLGGESLFNDGVGAVLFLALLATPESRALPSPGSFSSLFLLEAGGGIMLGIALGLLVHWLLRLAGGSYRIEVFLTLALAMGGYALADALHVSAPLEAVMAGLAVNSRSRLYTMSETTRENLDKFWGMLDDMLNVVLFCLLGFGLIVVTLSGRVVVAGLLAIPAILLARAVTVWTLLSPAPPATGLNKTGIVMTWGGLRGALSIALVLALAATPWSGPLLPITYIVVVFSVLVQGLTMVPLLRRLGFEKAS